LNAEIVVVDNASADSTPVMIKSEFPEMRLVRNTVNRYYAAASNQGLKEAKGMYLLLMNGDIFVAPETVRIMKNFMDSQPGVGAASCILRNRDMSVFPSCWRSRTPVFEIFCSELAMRLFPFLIRRLMNVFRYGEWDRKSTREVDILSDAFIMFRREALEAVGFYDERLRLYYTEDDLCRRLLKSGWRNCHVADTYVIHLLGESTRKRDRRLIHGIWTNDRTTYYSKYYGMTVGLLMRMLTRLSDTIVGRVERPDNTLSERG
jgi:hypothetical protein